MTQKQLLKMKEHLEVQFLLAGIDLEFYWFRAGSLRFVREDLFPEFEKN